jgi:hypothetical protein
LQGPYTAAAGGKAGAGGGGGKQTADAEALAKMLALIQMAYGGEGMDALVAELAGLHTPSEATTSQSAAPQPAQVAAAPAPANDAEDTDDAAGFSETDDVAKVMHDLTVEARKGKMDPVIGRDDEVQQCIQILCRRTKNNPMLIGEPGAWASRLCLWLLRTTVKRPMFITGHKSMTRGSGANYTLYGGIMPARSATVITALDYPCLPPMWCLSTAPQLASTHLVCTYFCRNRVSMQRDSCTRKHGLIVQPIDMY